MNSDGETPLLPHAAFHPFYGTYHAMGKRRPRPKHAMVYATQSIHKLLAGISQASHVLVQDSQTVKLDKHLFNEAYLMPTSGPTSLWKTTRFSSE